MCWATYMSNFGKHQQRKEKEHVDGVCMKEVEGCGGIGGTKRLPKKFKKTVG